MCRRMGNTLIPLLPVESVAGFLGRERNSPSQAAPLLSQGDQALTIDSYISREKKMHSAVRSLIATPTVSLAFCTQ